MNLTDLRDVLDERSATDHAAAHPHLTLSGVRLRLVRRRRRRRITAVSAVVLAVVAVGVASQTLRATPPPAPRTAAAPPKTINGFPEYAQGARLIASAALAPGARTLSLTFLPNSTDLVFFVRCDGAGITREFALSINGHPVMSGSGCAGSFIPVVRELGVVPGRSSRLVVTFPAQAPAGFGVGVGERVPVDRYVFPPRPATPAPLSSSGDLAAADDGGVEYRTAFLLRPDPADPNRPVSRTFTWGKGGHLTLVSQTPGALTVTVDGTKVAAGEWWDYDQGVIDGSSSSAWPLPGRRTRGTRVTVTVTPQRMTGDWAVAFQQPR